MNDFNKLELSEKCIFAVAFFSDELEKMENEIEEAENQLTKLKQKYRDYKEYLKIYKDLEGSVFGA